jgi:hypothetical protein
MNRSISYVVVVLAAIFDIRTVLSLFEGIVVSQDSLLVHRLEPLLLDSRAIFQPRLPLLLESHSKISSHLLRSVLPSLEVAKSPTLLRRVVKLLRLGSLMLRVCITT